MAGSYQNYLDELQSYTPGARRPESLDGAFIKRLLSGDFQVAAFRVYDSQVDNGPIDDAGLTLYDLQNNSLG